MISGKIDRREMETILEFKSNKSDTETSMNAVETLHKQNKNIIMLILELIMHLIDSEIGYESDKTKTEQKQKILSYSVTISNWINHFDPKIATNFDLKAEDDELFKPFNKTARLERFRRNSLVLHDLPSKHHVRG